MNRKINLKTEFSVKLILLLVAINLINCSSDSSRSRLTEDSIAGHSKPEAVCHVAGEYDRFGSHAELLHWVLDQIEPLSRVDLNSPSASTLQARETLARSPDSHPHVQGFCPGVGTSCFFPHIWHCPLRQPRLLCRTSPGRYTQSFH